MNSISVIVPTYNRASVVGRAIESIIAQTHPTIETIVVDDGSTDDTREVVAQFARESSRAIIYRRQNNAGCAAARNTGLELATGDFIAFLDSDDVWLPAAAEFLSASLIQSGADFVYSPAIEIYADGREHVNYPVAAERPEVFAVEHFNYTNLRNGAFMFRKGVLAAVPGIDERLKHNEDSDFIQRVAVLHKAAYCSLPTVKVYHHSGNKSRDRVGIYRALIKSTEAILDENPGFRDELGARADRRMRELKTKYVEALILAGDFEEASSVAARAKQDVSWVVRLASRTRSAIPMEVRDRLLALRRSGARKLRYIVGHAAKPSS